MEALTELIQNSNIPFVTAFLLGLITAISPCPLATNITATAYISKDISNKYRVFYQGLIYTAGRVISYTSLGIVIYFGASTFNISSFFQTYGEKLLGPLLIIFSIFMLNIIPAKAGFLGKLQKKFEGKKHFTYLNTLLLGIIFALAFCPLSGVFYFGMLIPMTLSTTGGLYLPVLFAIATALPVILIAYLLAFTVSGIGRTYNKIKQFEFWFRRIVALIFAVVGIYFTIIFYIIN